MNKKIKNIIGILILIVGAIFGLYVGIYLCLWGGVVSMYTGLIVTQSFWTFIWGLIKWIFAGTLGFLIFAGFGIISGIFFAD